MEIVYIVRIELTYEEKYYWNQKYLISIDLKRLLYVSRLKKENDWKNVFFFLNQSSATALINLVAKISRGGILLIELISYDIMSFSWEIPME